MYNTHLRYLAVAFVEASSLNVNSQNVPTLMVRLSSVLGDVQLLPNIIHEQTSSGLTPRYSFLTIDGTWQINLLSGRFDVAQVSQNPIQGSDIGNYSTFSRLAGEVLITLLEYFQITPHRLGLVQEGLLREMSNEEMVGVARRLMNFTSTYENYSLTDWDWRAVANVNREFGGNNEPINSVSTIRKVAALAVQSGQVAPTLVPLNRIRVDIDNNTLPSNTEPRFDSNRIRSYFTEAIRWQEQLIAEFRPLIFGEQ